MDLYEKLRKIEAILQNTSSKGERQAAKKAKARLQERMGGSPLEYQVRVRSRWEKKLFVAICAKYGYRTYRYKRQKQTTTMVNISKRAMDTLIWPEYKRYAKLLGDMIEDITDDLIDKVHRTDQEERVISGQLEASLTQA